MSQNQRPTLNQLEGHDAFVSRHVGPNDDEIERMLEVIGYDSLETMTDAIVPTSIRSKNELNLPDSLTEVEALAKLRAIALKNKITHPPSSSATFWRARPGTPLTRPIRLKSHKAAWKLCSISRPCART